jgi:hypothetical protein
MHRQLLDSLRSMGSIFVDLAQESFAASYPYHVLDCISGDSCVPDSIHDFLLHGDHELHQKCDVIVL